MVPLASSGELVLTIGYATEDDRHPYQIGDITIKTPNGALALYRQVIGLDIENETFTLLSWLRRNVPPVRGAVVCLLTPPASMKYSTATIMRCLRVAEEVIRKEIPSATPIIMMENQKIHRFSGQGKDQRGLPGGYEPSQHGRVAQSRMISDKLAKHA